jgi:hypothetical protein
MGFKQHSTPVAQLLQGCPHTQDGVTGPLSDTHSLVGGICPALRPLQCPPPHLTCHVALLVRGALHLDGSAMIHVAQPLRCCAPLTPSLLTRGLESNGV